MSEKRIPMGQPAYDRLLAELDHLKKVDRPAIILEIATARAHGDLAENAEYHAAKEKQGQLEDKIIEVEDKLARAEIMNINVADSDHIVFGAVVSVKNLGTNKVLEYTIVGSEEVDPTTGRISSASPIGKSLMGKKPGDVVEVQIPKGKIRLQVLKYH